MQGVQDRIRLRVLVVDDDPIFLDYFCGDLPAERFDVLKARDGVEAMEMLERERFDVLGVDLVMPRIDGLRLIALIRATPGLYTLPILVITGRLDQATREESVRVGANGFLTKPVRTREVPELLERLAAGVAASVDG
jgi:CheY-like chemotaxis protein